MYLLWKVFPMKTTRALVGTYTFLLIGWQEWVERINGHEKLWRKWPIHHPTNIQGQPILFFKSCLFKEILLQRICVCVCVCVCVLGGIICSHCSIFSTIKYKLYSTPQIVLKMFGTRRIFCCPLDEHSPLGRCWGTTVFYKDSLFIPPREAKEV